MARVDAIGMSSIATADLSVTGTDSVSKSEGVQSFDWFLSNHSSEERNGMVNETGYDVKKDGTTTVEQPETSRLTKKVSKESETDVECKKSDDVSEGMEQLTQQIREEVKECLDMEDAQLEEALAQLGISWMDLLNPTMLQQFVLVLNQAEGTIDFLTNESMLQSLNQLTQLMANISNEFKDLLASMELLSEPVVLDDQVTMAGVVNDALTEDSAEVTDSVKGTVEQGIVSGKNETIVSENASEESESLKGEVQTENTRLTVSEGNTGEDGALTNEQGQSETMYQTGDAELFSNEEITVEDDRTMATLFGESFNNVKDAVGKLNEANIPASQKMQQMIDIVHQITNHVRSRLNANTTTLEMQLNPASLGKVVLTVASKDGVMTANFRVESEEAKNALESQMASLKEVFHEKNLKVESVDVEISEFNFTQSNETKKQMDEELAKESKKRFKFADELEDGMEVEKADEELRRRVMRDSGGSIDYTA